MNQLDLVGLKIFPWFWERFKLAVILLFDLLGFLRFGPRAPKKYELLYVETETVTMGYQDSRPHHLGVVRDKYWSLPLVGVENACDEIPKYARKRTAVGETWESCGELERVISHRRNYKKSTDPRTKDFQDHWQTRYGALDVLIEELKETRRLRPQREFRPQSHFREKEGIGICIDAEGNTILTDGHHRFGISLGLGLAFIPVALHAVHPGFMKGKNWRESLQKLRADPNR